MKEASLLVKVAEDMSLLYFSFVSKPLRSREVSERMYTSLEPSTFKDIFKIRS